MPISRRTLLAGAGIAATGLTGCAGISTTQPRGEGPLTKLSGDKVTLRFAVRPKATELAWAQVLADDFHKMHPNITVKVEGNAQVTDIRTLVTGALSRNLPDIMYSTDVNTQTQSSKGLLLDLTDYMAAYGMKQSDFTGKIMDLGQWKGRQYVVPRGSDQVVVVYNPELFKKFHVPEPKLGWKWDEFLDTCKTLQRTIGSTKYWAMGIGNTYSGYPIYIPFMRGWGGDISTPDGSKATLDDPRVIKGVTEMMDFFGTYTAAYEAPPADPFLGGTAAMDLIVRPFVFSDLVNEQRTKWVVAFEPKFVNVPLYPTPKIGAGMAGWAGSITTRHPHETAAFLVYTLSRRGQAAFSKASGEVPVRKDLVSGTAWQDVLNFHGKVDQEAFIAFGDDQSLPPSNFPIVANGKMSGAVQDALDSIRLKTQTVAEAMRQCNTTVNHALVGLQ